MSLKSFSLALFLVVALVSSTLAKPIPTFDDVEKAWKAGHSEVTRPFPSHSAPVLIDPPLPARHLRSPSYPTPNTFLAPCPLRRGYPKPRLELRGRLPGYEQNPLWPFGISRRSRRKVPGRSRRTDHGGQKCRGGCQTRHEYRREGQELRRELPRGEVQGWKCQG